MRFDLARDKVDYISYGLLEVIKNGKVFSTKYESCLKEFKPPSMVVVINQCPAMDKLSADRYVYMYINS